MIIDANMYWMPEVLFKDPQLLEHFFRLAAEKEGYNAYTMGVAGSEAIHIAVEKPKGKHNLNYVSDQYQLEKQLNALDRASVDNAILKLPGCQHWLDLELAQLFNTEMAAHVAKADGRLYGLATIPAIADEAVYAELERCKEELQMVGVQLSTHYQGRYLDDPSFRPLLAKIAELDMPIYVHHCPLPPQYDALLDYDNLRRSYGRSIDQVTAITRELFSGIFVEFENLKMVHSMLGGAYFAFTSLMFPNRPKTKEVVSRFDVDNEGALKALRNNIYFEMSHAAPWGKAQLESAIDILGSDRVIFGSSYPVREPWLLDGPSFVSELAIDEEQKQQVLGANAQKVYKL